MNKKIKIIELLNRIANRENLPKRIIYQNKIYRVNNDNQYFEEEADENGYRNILGYYNELTYVLNDDVEILEDNTEEIEELPIEILNEKDLTTHIIKHFNKINELVKAVNQIRKDLNK